ncbi:MAG TPA: hypothetical protein VKX96_14990 [Chloroflexota bacterium]|nr:hypothetical protein [Chloroflexota bacterium]
MPHFLRRLPADLTAFVFFVVLGCTLTYPFPLQLADHLRDGGDSYEYAWDIGFGAYQLTHHPLHLYDGNIFYPFPLSLAYSDSTVPNVILGTPIVMLTNNPVLALNVLILLTFILGGYGMYLFVTQRTGSRSAGIVAGIMYGFSPFRYDHLAQLPNVSMEWAPFALWSFDRYLASDRVRWAAGFSLFCVLQILVSFYYAFILGIGIAFYVVIRLIQSGRSWIRLRVIIPFVGSCLVGALAAAPFIVPYFTLERMFGLKRTIDEAVYFSAWPANFLAANRTSPIVLIAPLVSLWQRLWPDAQIAAPERWLYPGLLIVVLSVVAIVRRHWSFVIAPVCMVVAGVVLSFGPVFHLAANVAVPLPIPMPYTILYYHLPGFPALRVPSRFGALVVFGLAILAGDGLAYLSERYRPAGTFLKRDLERKGHLLAVACAGIAIAEGMTILPLTPVKVGSSIPAVYRWLAKDPEPGAVVELPIDDNAFHESPRSYYSTYDHRPLVNGFRSFIPPLYNNLAKTISFFPSVQAIDTLKRLAVRFVIVHEAELTPGDRQRMALIQNVPGIQRVAQLGSDDIYRVDGTPTSTQLGLSLQQTGCINQNSSSGQSVTSLAILQSNDDFTVLAPGTQSLKFQLTWRTKDGIVLQEVTQAPVNSWVIASPFSVPITYLAPSKPGLYSLDITLIDQPWLRASANIPFVLNSNQPTATLAGPPQLMKAQIDSPRPAPRDGVNYTLAWRVPTVLPHPLVVFVNAYDGHDVYWSFPRGTEPRFPGSTTCGGTFAMDSGNLPLRAGIPAGQYWLEAGLLDSTTGQRMPFRNPDGKMVTRYVVGSFWIRPNNVFPTIAQEANAEGTYHFGGTVDLQQWSISGAVVPNGRLDVSMLWVTKAPMARNYTVFVHVTSPAGNLIAQFDGQPTGGIYPTSAWLPGESVLDRYSVQLPSSLPPGPYKVEAGLYDLKTLQRLPVSSEAGESPADYVLLGTLGATDGG